MQKHIPEIKLSDYNYHLPEERIAQYPLDNRDSSKLLVYKNGTIEHSIFKKIDQFLPKDSLIFFNDTKVIPARLKFKKATGASIEIFLLQPLLPFKDITLAMQQTNEMVWKCTIGNLKKWKDDQTLYKYLDIEGFRITLKAYLKDRQKMSVLFQWDKEVKFLDIIDKAGNVPLPPYIGREANESDRPRYQTVYSKRDGAVAAPTAGLHFNTPIIKKLKTLGHTIDYLTLHVSAGTFQPIKENNVVEHPMHKEQIVISKKNIENLIANGGKTIATGTTSMRVLESIYWYGVKLLFKESDQLKVSKLDPYDYNEEKLPKSKIAFQAIIQHMEDNRLTTINGETEIMIFPGYKFRVCDGLITNYHMPGSTLILLVAAFVGKNWRQIYHEALSNNYRFLSYGDSSLLLPDDNH